MNTIETVMIPVVGLAITLSILSDRGQSLLQSFFKTGPSARMTAYLLVLIGVTVQAILEYHSASTAYTTALLSFNGAVAGVFSGKGWAQQHKPIISNNTTTPSNTQQLESDQ